MIRSGRRGGSVFLSAGQELWRIGPRIDAVQAGFLPFAQPTCFHPESVRRETRPGKFCLFCVISHTGLNIYGKI